MAISPNEQKVLARAARIMEREMKALDADVMSSPNAVREFIKYRYAGLKYEMLGVIYLDNRHRVLGFEELFRGSIAGAQVHPREILAHVLDKGANAVIIVHNHPSKICEPSDADIAISRRVTDALSLIDCRLLDSLIVGGTNITSLAERGLI